MTTIVGEIASGGDSIVLVAGGLDMDGVALAARRLKTLTPKFSRSDPPGALLAPLTWSTVVQLAATFGDDWAPGPSLRNWIASETERRTKVWRSDGNGLSFAPPTDCEPRPYQVDGAVEIARTGRCLIFDEPRTGKSVTTVLGLLERYHRRHGLKAGDRTLPVVVVCPASVVDPWVEIWQTWAPGLTAVAWRGPKRRALAGAADVYVTSYDTASRDCGPMTTAGAKSLRPLYDLAPYSVVIDECHYLKNQGTQRSQAIRRLAGDAAKRGGAIVALSGTPITHHPADLWPTLACLDPASNPSRERWVNRYCDVVPGDYQDVILGLNRHTEPEFRLSILGQHRRVARADVMADLPPKVYSVRTVDLPVKWRKAYDDMETQMLAELPDGEELSVMGVLAQMTRLSQLASAAADVHVTEELNEQTGELVPHTEVTLKAPSWKVDALLEVLAERPGEKVVCFAPSAQLIRLAGAAAAAEGYGVGYVIGGQPARERTDTIRAFQTGDLNLICATTGAGGTGITLSAAGTLVFLQRPWSLVESLQAEDRAEGDLNATRGTEIVDIVARNTLDSRVRAVLRERAGQLSDLVQDPRIVSELLGGSTATTERKAS